MEPLSLTMWLLMYPAPDVPGEWVAHWLDNDVMTQGTGPAHAWQMALEAQGMFMTHYLAAGRMPPMRSAPDADWRRLRDVLAGGRSNLDIDSVVRQGNLAAIAVNLSLDIRDGNVPVPSRVLVGAAESQIAA